MLWWLTDEFEPVRYSGTFRVSLYLSLSSFLFNSLLSFLLKGPCNLAVEVS